MRRSDEFDPLYPTEEQYEQLVRGYLYGLKGRTLPQEATPAYRHGFRTGRNDRKGKVESYQVDLIARMKRANELN